MATRKLLNQSKVTQHHLHQISTRNKTIRRKKPRRRPQKSFKFIDEFIPASKEYLSKEHLDHLIGMTEVEDPIPPQLPKQKKQKLIEPFWTLPTKIEYEQTFPEASILSPAQPRFVELV